MIWEIIMTIKAQLEELQRKIKRYRIEKELTQKDLALMTGLSVRSIQRFEGGGDISLENYLKIIDALGLSDMVINSIPDMDERPSAYLDRYLHKTKQRARKTKKNEQIEFKWGDEI